MPGPKPPEIVLAETERRELERLVRARTTGQHLAMRARIVLLAADGLSTEAIARHLHVEADTARQWRARWRASASGPLPERRVVERLADSPKSGRPARITPEQICQIVALACELPADSDRPISQWSARDLADEIMRRNIVERISPRHAGRVLKSGGPQTASDSLLADPTGRYAEPAGAHR